jgi:cobalt-zinc-cadmium efflux system outer membrane protein
MSLQRLLALSGALLLSGCLYQVREQVDQDVCRLATLPYDQQPALPAASQSPPKGSSGDRNYGGKTSQPSAGTDIQTAAYMQGGDQLARPADVRDRLDLRIPAEVPGSEARRIQLPSDPAAKARTIRRIYPKLPPLPAEPKALPGPSGKPYTLADFQRLAVENVAQLRQAASDVLAARGNLIQARAYPNPTVSYLSQPSSDGSTSGVQGFSVDQVIKTCGKLKLAGAAAQMDLANAELALLRARSDLATAVRNAYFSFLVAKETVRVNKALARFTDEVYRLITGYLAGGFAAPYEPGALRALANTARMNYRQSIQTYIYSWQQLVATLGLRHLPLSEVAGRLDAAIPYFDYDLVLSHVLRNHTDVLTARNTLEKARYSLKLAQVAPFPDVDVNVGFLKDLSVPPKQFTHTVSIGVPFPIWDRNRGNIMAAEAALYRAKEEPHRVEVALTNTLASAYMGYKNNLEVLEQTRVYILPDQVRTYLGALRRRQLDMSASLYDLVGAQQTLSTSVTTYLTTLGSLWSSVVAVADLLQTDDLFQLAKPRAVPALPDLDTLTPWPCCHTCPPPGAAGTCASAACSATTHGSAIAKHQPAPVQPEHKGVVAQPLQANAVAPAARSEPKQVKQNVTPAVIVPPEVKATVKPATLVTTEESRTLPHATTTTDTGSEEEIVLMAVPER